MNTDSVKTEKDAVDDGEKKSVVDEEWRLKSCWSVDEEEAVDLTVAG